LFSRFVFAILWIFWEENWEKCEHSVSDFYFLFGDFICGGKNGNFILKKTFINFFALPKNWKKKNTDHSFNIANYLQHIWFPSNYVWSYYYYYYYHMSLKRPDVWSLNLHSEWLKISRYFGPQLAGANRTTPPVFLGPAQKAFQHEVGNNLSFPPA
jgi:hypothetical protein